MRPSLAPAAGVTWICLGSRISRWPTSESSELKARGLLVPVLAGGGQERLREVLESDERVVGYHRVRLRKSGSQRPVDMHLLLDPELSLQDAPDLAEKVVDDVRDAFPRAVMVTHLEQATAAPPLSPGNESEIAWC